MIKLIKNYRLDPEEFIMTPDHPDTRHFKIYFKGKLVKNVTGIIFTRKVKGNVIENEVRDDWDHPDAKDRIVTKEMWKRLKSIKK